MDIIYYTTNKLDGTPLNDWVLETMLASKLPIISVTQVPMELGHNIPFRLNSRRGRSHSMLYNQILTGLKASKSKYVFFCEHDVLYHPSHFTFKPSRDDTYYYNNNAYKYRLSDRKVVTYDTGWLSQICASRELLVEHYVKRLEMIANGEKAYGYEPGTGQSRTIDKHRVEYWESEYPNIDIRHGDNWTGVQRMAVDEFKNKKNCKNFREIDVRKIPGWDTERLLSL